ncbi:hypothetical protein E4P29_08190 [Rhodococcus sp. 1R11]|nr:hypothetical protein E4P29_08190 [Rhodococcus sp. 1R11]
MSDAPSRGASHLPRPVDRGESGRASYHGVDRCSRTCHTDRKPMRRSSIMCAHLIRVASRASPQRMSQFAAALRLTATSHRIEGIDFGRQ